MGSDSSSRENLVSLKSSLLHCCLIQGFIRLNSQVIKEVFFFMKFIFIIR